MEHPSRKLETSKVSSLMDQARQNVRNSIDQFAERANASHDHYVSTFVFFCSPCSRGRLGDLRHRCSRGSSGRGHI